MELIVDVSDCLKGLALCVELPGYRHRLSNVQNDEDYAQHPPRLLEGEGAVSLFVLALVVTELVVPEELPYQVEDGEDDVDERREQEVQKGGVVAVADAVVDEGAVVVEAFDALSAGHAMHSS